ncbi:hypothetical protein T492DRAFT_840744 [Pavlovales sp. CCMP2436]|nr:hypothetical protein T492DRAFT_840744 [Pavlovales sp. CCMP2436]
MLRLFAALLLAAASRRERQESVKTGETELEVVGTSVGGKLLRDDALTRIWELTLQPGESGGVHRHEFDYHFVVTQPSTLRVSDANGTFLFDFEAKGTFGFRLVGDSLVPIEGELPWNFPATHSAQNVGESAFSEFIFENKASTNAVWPRPPGGPLKRALRHAQNLLKRLAGNQEEL